jgi:hypothetical protein
MDALLSLLSWQAIAASIIVYYATLAAYRLYLHPLARFPGPKLAAATRLYEGYYDLYQSGQYTFKIGELHKQYGQGTTVIPCLPLFKTTNTHTLSR